MPFTLSHPAAVLPFVREPFVPAALVAGAMAPDVPYFVPAPRHAGAWYEPFVNGTLTHHWPGMLTVAVPTAAVLLLAWWLVRSPLADLVVRRRSGAGQGTSEADATGTEAAGAEVARRLRAGAWLVASLVLGVLTHVVWDSFTHADGYAVENLAILRGEVAGVGVARLLQHLSTLVGAAVLVVWGGRRLAGWLARGGRLGLTRGRVAVMVGLLAVGVLGGVLGAGEPLTEGAPLEGVLFELVTAGGFATAVGVLLHAVAWHAVRRVRVRRSVLV